MTVGVNGDDIKLIGGAIDGNGTSGSAGGGWTLGAGDVACAGQCAGTCGVGRVKFGPTLQPALSSTITPANAADCTWRAIIIAYGD